MEEYDVSSPSPWGNDSDEAKTDGASKGSPFTKQQYKEALMSGSDNIEEILESLSGAHQPTENEELMDRIQKSYSEALDSVGINMADPLAAYSSHFNTNNETLGLDPQRPGKSHVFITRPDLNLSADTIERIPFIKYILETDIGNVVCDLLQYPGTTNESLNVPDEFKTNSVFDPLKSNTCKTVSGLKDMIMEKYETEGDLAGNQLTYAGGADGVESIGEVTLVFEDPQYSPIFLSHFIHFMYIHHLCKGTVRPHKEYLTERVIDYTSSIYIFKMAEDNKTILRWSKLTGCFPLNVPMASANHSRDVNLEEYSEFTTSWAYNRYEVMNPKILSDFNHIAIKGLEGKAHITPSGELEITGTSAPKRLIRSSNYDEGPEKGSRNWAAGPYIKGNQLLFI